MDSHGSTSLTTSGSALPTAGGSTLLTTSGHWVLAAGIIIAAVVFGWFFKTSRDTQDSVRVVGSASKRVVSDIVKWRLSIARTATEQGISEGYARLHDDVQNAIERLKSFGVTDEEITVQSISTYPIYNPTGVGALGDGTSSEHNINQSILVISPKVADIERLAVDPRTIIGEGVVLQNSNLEYFHSDLAAIKRELLKDAMIDARARAEVLAGAGEVRITKLLNSSVGVFQITEPFSTEVSDYGMYTTSTKQKDITVTVRAAFMVE